MQTVDLHTHTTFSDGTDSPEELVKKAHRFGLAALAVTDHDTCAGLRRAQNQAKLEQLEVISGCELSTKTELGELHILGLWVEETPKFEKFLKLLQDRRNQRNESMILRLKVLGLPITLEEVQALAGEGSVGRPHLALAMQRRGYVQSLREAFQKYLGAGCSAYVPKQSVSPKEAVINLRATGATVVLAHPFLHHYPEAWLKQVIVELMPHGLDALEVWHTEHSQAEQALGLAWARELGLGQSGGSDYHGTNKVNVELGCGHGNLRLSLSLLQALKERRLSQGLPVA